MKRLKIKLFLRIKKIWGSFFHLYEQKQNDNFSFTLILNENVDIICLFLYFTFENIMYFHIQKYINVFNNIARLSEIITTCKQHISINDEKQMIND